MLQAVRVEEAVRQGSDEYGDRYAVDFELTRGVRRAKIRSLWIIRRLEAFPRLTTCYVLLDQDGP